MNTQTLTQLEFTEQDFREADRMASRLGYKQTAHTSTSALWGLYCLPENPEHFRAAHRNVNLPPFRGGCIIKTQELGLMFVQTAEDMGIGG